MAYSVLLPGFLLGLAARSAATLQRFREPVTQSRSTIITASTLLRLGRVLFNTAIATAIADSLIENSEVFLLGGDRLRNNQQKSTSQEE